MPHKSAEFGSLYQLDTLRKEVSPELRGPLLKLNQQLRQLKREKLVFTGSVQPELMMDYIRRKGFIATQMMDEFDEVNRQNYPPNWQVSNASIADLYHRRLDKQLRFIEDPIQAEARRNRGNLSEYLDFLNTLLGKLGQLIDPQSPDKADLALTTTSFPRPPGPVFNANGFRAKETSIGSRFMSDFYYLNYAYKVLLAMNREEFRFFVTQATDYSLQAEPVVVFEELIFGHESRHFIPRLRQLVAEYGWQEGLRRALAQPEKKKKKRDKLADSESLPPIQIIHSLVADETSSSSSDTVMTLQELARRSQPPSNS